jgi:hypothetical protein
MIFKSKAMLLEGSVYGRAGKINQMRNMASKAKSQNYSIECA